MSFLKIKAFGIDLTDTFTFANVNVTSNLAAGNANLGNLATANYFSGDGSALSNLTGANITGQVGNALVAGTVYTAAQPNITSVGTLTSLAVTGNITGGNVTGANLVSANYFTGTLTTAAQPNITSVGTLTSLTVNGDITSTGNLIVAGTTTYVNSTVTAIKDPIIDLGNGANNAALSSDDGMDRGSLLHYYTGGSTVDAFMGWKNSSGEFTFASNVSTSNNVVTVNAYGNIKAGNANLGNLVTSNYFTGNGSLLSSITGANVTGTVGNATHATVADSANSVAGANVTGQVGNALVAGTVYTAAQPNITSVGTLSSLTVSGNITTGGILTDNIYHANGAVYSFMTVSGSNTQIQFNDGGAFGATANLTFNKTSNTLTVDKIVANGAGLTSLTGSNVTGQVGNALVAGTVYTAAQPNITSVGTLTSLAVSGTTNLGAVGNVTITGGTSGYVLKTDGAGVLSWVAQKTLGSTVDEFTGNGVQTAFTLSSTPASKNYTFAVVQGVMQPKSSYSVTGAVLTFSVAPPNTALVEITTLS
jgi:hypothetical protein